MIKINSASRVLELLRQASTHGDHEKVFQVWGAVFDIQERDNNKRNMEITRCLSLVHDEIESIIEEMNLSTSDEFQCRQLLSSVFNVLAVQALMTEWANLKKNLTREVFLCLGYCREVLPDEEAMIDIEDVEEIKELLSTLEAQLKDSKLPVYTKKLIQKHISGIHTSLHNYQIIGAKSLKNAMNTAIGEVIAHKEIFVDAAGTQEVTTLGKILKKVSAVTDSVVKTEKLLTSGEKIVNYGSKAIEMLDGII